MRPKLSFGVVVGPSNPNDQQVYNRVIKQTKTNPQEAELIPIDDYNFIAIKLKSYPLAKHLTEAKYPDLKIVMVDINEIGNYAKKVFPILPKLIHGTSINFSNSQKKFGINLNFPPNVGTLLFFAYLYCKQNNIVLDSFNFANNRLKKVDGFKQILDLFDVKAVDLSRNIINAPYEKELIFGAAKIITNSSKGDSDDDDETSNNNDNKTDNECSSDESENSASEQDKFSILPNPHLQFRSLYHTPRLSLDMFPPVQLDVNDFPTHLFISNLFRNMWDRFDLSKCQSYYFNGSIFSSFFLAQRRFDNIHPHMQVKGADNIIQALLELFPNGFKAHPTLVNYSVLETFSSSALFAVIIHGVFAHTNEYIYGFDRSMTIGYSNSEFRIMNDCIFIRDPPLIE